MAVFFKFPLGSQSLEEQKYFPDLKTSSSEQQYLISTTVTMTPKIFPDKWQSLRSKKMHLSFPRKIMKIDLQENGDDDDMILSIFNKTMPMHNNWFYNYIILLISDIISRLFPN